MTGQGAVGDDGVAADVSRERPSGTRGEPREVLVSDWLERVTAGRERLAVTALVVASVAAAWIFRFTQDDAFITYRYARNLANGEGLVFNPGERVEGYTNFLWTVIHAIPEYFGWSTPVFSWLLSIAMMVGVVLVVLAICRELFDSRGFTLLVGLVLVANMTFIGYATGGLETMMQTLCLMGVLWALLPGLIERVVPHPWRLVVGGVLAGLAILTRLDSTVFLVAVYLGTVARQSGIVRRGADRGPVNWTPVLRTLGISALPAALLVVPWLVWKLDYYGELLPNTFLAKSSGQPLQQVLYGLMYVVAYFISYGAFLLIGRLRRHGRSFFAVEGMAAAFAVVPVWLVYVCYVGADFMEYRFMVVITPLLAMLAAWLVDRFVNLRTQALLVAVLLVFSLAHQLIKPPIGIPVLSFKDITHWPTDAPTTWYGLGTLLEEQFPGGPDVEGQPTIAVAPLGVISYYSDLETVDMLGLADAEVARSGEEAQMYYPGHIKMATPEYLVERGVDLVVGQPSPISDPERFDGYRLSQLVAGYPVADLNDLPDSAVVVEIPARRRPGGPQVVWPTLYFGGNDKVDEAIETNGWMVKPIIDECRSEDLVGWLGRVVATRTCPDL